MRAFGTGGKCRHLTFCCSAMLLDQISFCLSSCTNSASLAFALRLHLRVPDTKSSTSETVRLIYALVVTCLHSLLTSDTVVHFAVTSKLDSKACKFSGPNTASSHLTPTNSLCSSLKGDSSQVSAAFTTLPPARSKSSFCLPPPQILPKACSP